MSQVKIKLLSAEAFNFSADATFDCSTAAISEPILDLVETQGLVLPYGCRAGSCGSCRVTVTAGADLLEARGPVEQDTLERCKDPEHVRLACRVRVRAGASGDICVQVAPPVDPSAFGE